MGIYGFVGELFMSVQEQYRKPGTKRAGTEAESEYYGGTPQEERQKFNDFVNQGMMFKEWKKFKHPQYGEIEIGGWRTFTTRIPPVFMLHEMVHRNASLVLFVAKNTPEIKMEVLEVKNLADNLYRIRVRASNTNAIPTLSGNALRRNIVRKDMFTISGKDIEVVSGGIVEDLAFEQINFVEHRPDLIFSHVPSFGKRDIQWIVRGSDNVKISYAALKAKNQVITINLNK